MSTTIVFFFRPHRWGIFLTLLTLGVISTILVIPTQADGPPLPLDEYWRQVEETQALVTSLEDVPTETAHAQLSGAAEQWERITELVLSDETLIPVDHSFLLSQLRADPPDLTQLDHLLTAILTARDTWPQPKTTSLDTDVLEKILARPEFQWQSEQPSPLDEWWLQLQERFWELVSRFLSSDSGIVGVPLLRYVLTGLGALALILVLAYALRSLIADFVADTEIAPENAIGDENMAAAAALKRAQLLSGEGDYRTAVRYLYLSTLLWLDERGLLHYDPACTNREFLRQLSSNDSLHKALLPVVDFFDRVWYGFAPLDGRAYAAFSRQVEQVRQVGGQE